MKNVNVECVSGLDDVWYIRVGDSPAEVMTPDHAKQWIYQGMELWHADEEDGVLTTVNRQRVNVKCENFTGFMANLNVRMENYIITSVYLTSDGVALRISPHQRKFTFEAIYDDEDVSLAIPTTV